jgi:hypothetical protein
MKDIETPPADRIGRLADRVIPDLEAAIEELVNQDGAWTKARADTLNSLNRLLESFVDFSRSTAERRRLAEENEQDVAGILATIDRRIVELAGAFSGELGGKEPLPSAG